MKIYCGTDIVKIQRIENLYKKHGDAFLQKYFTLNEIEYIQSKKNSMMQTLAGVFASKEAIYKAFYPLCRFSFLDVELEYIEKKPYIRILNCEKLKSVGINILDLSFDLSISHDGDYAICNVVVLDKR